MAGNMNRFYSAKELFELSANVVSSLPEQSARSFFEDLPDANKLSICPLTPCLLPVVSAIQSIGPAVDSTFELVQAIKSSCAIQRWRQPYLAQDIGARFVNGAAWFPIADVDGPIIYRQGLVEIMLLCSGVTYPKHSHSPEELYIVLAGQVWWETDDSAKSHIWKKAGEVIHHLPHQAHAITAGEEAVLILNLWRGGSFEMPSII